MTEEPHQCMLIDLTQGCDEKLRFRSHYLPRGVAYACVDAVGHALNHFDVKMIPLR